MISQTGAPPVVQLDLDAAREILNDFDVLYALVRSGVALLIEQGHIMPASDEMIVLHALNTKTAEFRKRIDPIRVALNNH